MKIGTAVRVRGYRGVAFRVVGYPRRWETDYDPETGQEYSEGEWIEQDESCGRAIVVMVGDDREHDVGIDECTPIDEEAFCASCGQLGCQGDGR